MWLSACLQRVRKGCLLLLQARVLWTQLCNQILIICMCTHTHRHVLTKGTYTALELVEIYRDGVWLCIVRSALLLAVVLCCHCLLDCVGYWVLLRLFCLLSVTLHQSFRSSCAYTVTIHESQPVGSGDLEGDSTLRVMATARRRQCWSM